MDLLFPRLYFQHELLSFLFASSPSLCPLPPPSFPLPFILLFILSHLPFPFLSISPPFSSPLSLSLSSSPLSLSFSYILSLATSLSSSPRLVVEVRGHATTTGRCLLGSSTKSRPSSRSTQRPTKVGATRLVHYCACKGGGRWGSRVLAKVEAI